LKGSDTVAGDRFGGAVAISGTTTVVGASYRSRMVGRAYVFAETTAGWRQVAELRIPDTAVGDVFGTPWQSRARPLSWVLLATVTMPAGHTCSPRRPPVGC